MYQSLKFNNIYSICYHQSIKGSSLDFRAGAGVSESGYAPKLEVSPGLLTLGLK